MSWSKLELPHPLSAQQCLVWSCEQEGYFQSACVHSSLNSQPGVLTKIPLPFWPVHFQTHQLALGKRVSPKSPAAVLAPLSSGGAFEFHVFRIHSQIAHFSMLTECLLGRGATLRWIVLKLRKNLSKGAMVSFQF